MTTKRLPTITPVSALLVFVALVAASASGAEGPAGLGEGWSTHGGDWRPAREIVPIIHQRATAGTAAAFHDDLAAQHGVWRTTVKLSQGTGEAGLWLHADAKQQGGLRVALGGQTQARGFSLRLPGDPAQTLWDDPYAPWTPYHAYLVEAVVERGRVRVQMFDGLGKLLISQSPWIDVDDRLTETPGASGLYTEDGAARFYAFGRADGPLSPLVDDPPNLRRLIRDDDSPWVVVGEGNWMWLTSKRRRLRQGVAVERTWAIHRGMRGAHRAWECRVRVDPGTKGAGMNFQVDAESNGGFIAWLGGRYGAGALMLYQREPESRALWSGKQDQWHYDTDYVLRAETRPGEVRVRQLAADGETVISDSSWIKVDPKYTGKEGFLGFHTWSGTAEFWGFSDETRAAAQTQPPAAKPSGTTRPQVASLGDGWESHGGAWQWADTKHTRLRHTGDAQQALVLNRGLAGMEGTWRCRVRRGEETGAAGLVFQADAKAAQGFACLLTGDGARLESLEGRTLWESSAWKPAAATEYVLEGVVATDRVAARVLAADGKTVLAQSPDVYVPESNNTRRGHLGLLVREGPAELWDWAAPGR